MTISLRIKTGEQTSPLRVPKLKAVRRGFHPDKSGIFHGTPAELALFIREGNGDKVLHKCAVVKRNIGRAGLAPTERAEL